MTNATAQSLPACWFIPLEMRVLSGKKEALQAFSISKNVAWNALTFRFEEIEKSINSSRDTAMNQRIRPSQRYLKFSKLTGSGDLLRRIPEDGSDPSRITVGVDEGTPLNAMMPFPSDGKAGGGLLQLNRLRIAIPSQRGGQLIGDVQQPKHLHRGRGLIALSDLSQPFAQDHHMIGE